MDIGGLFANRKLPPRPRSFLTRAYPTMKKNNPTIPIMLRDAAGTPPKVYARYGTHSDGKRLSAP